MRPGRVTWIGLRPARHAVMVMPPALRLAPEDGAVGDHYSSRTGAARGVTLIEQECLAAIFSYLGAGSPDPQLLRRNIVTSGINLDALRERRFQVGGAVLEHTGACHPCSRMEALLGPGGYNAVRGRGGVTARVVSAGEVSVGDAVVRLG
ncbi:MAG: MOSC domain-containing protein [Janthinobacterium lividum]